MKEGELERLLLHLLVQFASGHNSRICTGPEPGVRDVIRGCLSLASHVVIAVLMGRENSRDSEWHLEKVGQCQNQQLTHSHHTRPWPFYEPLSLCLNILGNKVHYAICGTLKNIAVYT